eukprot:TRINITY_DN3163_c0_g1_i4.p1 TRINITY_DN3163_c0_g1~~TRINITY_DN3163_c0_g1_i4.p1  ORF type:complete len:301 (+),score=48.64 TRINITY_DN3163_c0_g1_i4:1194-2096(+)
MSCELPPTSVPNKRVRAREVLNVAGSGRDASVRGRIAEYRGEIHPTSSLAGGLGRSELGEGDCRALGWTEVSQLYGNLEGDTGGWSAELWASDRIITCLGFKFNQTVFSGYSGEVPRISAVSQCIQSCSRSSCGPVSAKDLIKPTFLEGAVAELAPFEPKLAAEASGGDGMQDKPVRYPAQSYPALNSSWGAVALEDLYFAGELMHGADYRRGNGNLVHGFRHSVEALFNWLSWRRHNVPWPTRSSDFPVMTTVTSPNGSLVIEEQEGAATSLASAVLDLVLWKRVVLRGCRWTRLQVHM